MPELDGYGVSAPATKVLRREGHALFHVVEGVQPYAFLPDSYDVIELPPDLVGPMRALEAGQRVAHSGRTGDRLRALLGYIDGQCHAASPPPLDLLGVYLVVSQHCPLRCSYCYAEFGRYGRLVRHKMDFETARRAVDLLYEMNPTPEYVQFFGGEPALNQTLIVQVVEYLERRFEAGKIAALPAFSMVSSLSVPLRPELVSAIRRTNFALVVSLDGPEDVNDAFRVDTRGRGTHARVSQGLHALNDMGLRPSIEATYTARHLNRVTPSEIYEYLHGAFGYHTLFVKPVLLAPGDPQRIDDQELWYDLQDRAIAMLVDRMAGRDPIYAGDLEHLVNTYVEQRLFQPNFYMCPDASGVAQITVHTNGDVYPDYIVINAPEHHMGNVHELDPGGLNRLRSVYRQFNKDRGPCRSCWARHFCGVPLSAETVAGHVYGYVDYGKCDLRRRSVDRFLKAVIQVERDPVRARAFNANLRCWHCR